jgi:hypothetical protein
MGQAEMVKIVFAPYAAVCARLKWCAKNIHNLESISAIRYATIISFCSKAEFSAFFHGQYLEIKFAKGLQYFSALTLGSRETADTDGLIYAW